MTLPSPSRSRRTIGLLLALLAVACAAAQDKDPSMPLTEVTRQLKQDLVARHGEGQRQRITRGIDQIASLWRPADGGAEVFTTFTRENFIADPAVLDATFQRFEPAFEALDGHLNEIGRELKRWSELDLGPILPVDRIFAAYDPWAHLADDLFASKAAFIVLLNFPLTTLEERIESGRTWPRRKWVEARLAARFSKRVPAEVDQQVARAQADGDAYIAEYNVWMHHLLDEEGRSLFPQGLRLISHWNLRDELKARYADPEGLARQKMIARVMERIVTQEIPRAVVNNPRLDWMPYSNRVRAAPAESVEKDAPAGTAVDLGGAREPDTRYSHLLATFHAARKVDPHAPAAPTHIARRFDEMREVPEARVLKLLEGILASPLVSRVARRIQERLGRGLEPFDIWYDGFKPRSSRPDSDLTAIVSKRYPSVAAFQADIPRILEGLGFSQARAGYLAERIVVDPARGAGHAMPAMRRGDKPRLRTRIGKDGMDYKGFNIAIHELGHNVEQVFSLYDVDHTLLAGVPNNAFTEALAFVFQERDLELLGLAKPDPEAEKLRALDALWMTYEISGPALVDIRVWHWMYDHPEATPGELREAVVAISREVWNAYYAPVFQLRDSVLLGIYSHMVSLMMYLPDYPLGHLIAFQIEEHMKGKSLGDEFERMARHGRVAPDLWMEHATGRPISADALLAAAARALE